MSKLLKIKHWQLFIFLFVVPFVCQIFFMVTSISLAVDNDNPEEVFSIFKYFPFVVMIPLGVLFAWLWSIGVEFAQYLPSGIKMNKKLFKIFFFVPLCYFLLLMITISVLFNAMPEMIANSEPPSFLFNPSFPLIVFLYLMLHLFSIFCLFYCFYFTAKTYKSVILGREALLSDYIGEFFMIWFNVIGIWLIQPKINRIVDKGDTGNILDQ